MRLTPKAAANGNGFAIWFRHPLLKKIVSRGLGTHDEIIAKDICRDITLLFGDSNVLQHPTADKLRGYDDRAVQIVFGEEAASKLLRPQRAAEKAPISEEEALIIANHIEAFQENKAFLEKLGETDPIFAELSRTHTFPEFYAKFCTPKVVKMLVGLADKQAKEIKILREENESLKEQNYRLLRTTNATVRVSIANAVDSWRPVYADGRKPDTVLEGLSAVDSFVTSLERKGATKLGEIKARDIDSWIQKLTRKPSKRTRKSQAEKPPEPLSPITKRNKRNALSVFFGWATRKYDLVEDPMTKVGSIPGVGRVPENILAIRRYADLTSLIKALEPQGYWQAWTTFACLAGPRFREQCYLKLNDVYFDEDGDYVRITSRSSGRRISGTKTGRERRIPIEQSVLKPILKSHLLNRLAAQRKSSATPAERSEWLFPSIVDDGTVERTITPVGLWSDNAVFLSNWRTVASSVAGKSADDFWTFGPAEWRHTFGTILGNCGWNSLEISRVMGNSPDVCEQHYVASTSSGNGSRWPFRWESVHDNAREERT